MESLEKLQEFMFMMDHMTKSPNQRKEALQRSEFINEIQTIIPNQTDEQCREGHAQDVLERLAGLFKKTLVIFPTDRAEFHESITILINWFSKHFDYVQEAEYTRSGLVHICPTKIDMIIYLSQLDIYSCSVLIVGLLSSYWRNIIRERNLSTNGSNSYDARFHKGTCHLGRWNLIGRMILHNPDQTQRRHWLEQLPDAYVKSLLYMDKAGLQDYVEKYFNGIYISIVVMKMDDADEFLFNWNDPKKKNKNRKLKVLKSCLTSVRCAGYTPDLVWKTELAELTQSTEYIDIRSFLKRFAKLCGDIDVHPWWQDKHGDHHVTDEEVPPDSRQQQFPGSESDGLTESVITRRMGNVSNRELITSLSKVEIERRQKSSIKSKGKLIPGEFHHAIVYEYRALDDVWLYSPNIVRIVHEVRSHGDKFKVDMGGIPNPGHGKKFDGDEHRIENYLAQVRRQMIARFYAREFTKKYGTTCGEVQVSDMCHVQCFKDSKSSEIVDLFNVDFLPSDVQIRNYMDYSLVGTFSHFTYQQSEGTLIIVDMKGCNEKVPNGRWRDIITDPVIHSTLDDGSAFYGEKNRGYSGFRKFWTRQHKQCNPMCKKIGLVRPRYSTGDAGNTTDGDTGNITGDAGTSTDGDTGNKLARQWKSAGYTNEQD